MRLIYQRLLLQKWRFPSPVLLRPRKTTKKEKNTWRAKRSSLAKLRPCLVSANRSTHATRLVWAVHVGEGIRTAPGGQVRRAIASRKGTASRRPPGRVARIRRASRPRRIHLIPAILDTSQGLLDRRIFLRRRLHMQREDGGGRLQVRSSYHSLRRRKICPRLPRRLHGKDRGPCLRTRLRNRCTRAMRMRNSRRVKWR